MEQGQHLDRCPNLKTGLMVCKCWSSGVAAEHIRRRCYYRTLPGDLDSL